ncbi:TPA: YegP family protein [Enterococcus faecalis]|nr:YegP family protein [Enterococcus faecalis]
MGCQNVFVIKKASNKKYYFVIKTEENEVIASSKTYYYKSSVLEIIESIKSDMDQKAIIVDTTFNWG